MTSPSNATSIADLTAAMKGLAGSGGGKDPTLQMTESGHAQYTQHIRDCRNTLKEQRDAAAKLTTYGNVGSLWSAMQTSDQLIDDVTRFVASVDDYIAYLDHFEDAVNAAFKQVQAVDKSS